VKAGVYFLEPTRCPIASNLCVGIHFVRVGLAAWLRRLAPPRFATHRFTSERCERSKRQTRLNYAYKLTDRQHTTRVFSQLSPIDKFSPF